MSQPIRTQDRRGPSGTARHLLSRSKQNAIGSQIEPGTPAQPPCEGRSLRGGCSMGGLQQGRGGWRGEGNPPRGSGAEAGPQDRFQVRLWFARGHTLTRARARPASAPNCFRRLGPITCGLRGIRPTAMLRHSSRRSRSRYRLGKALRRRNIPRGALKCKSGIMPISSC
jgi:hypothetical protein